MPTPIRFALVGARRASPFAQALHFHPESRLVALCDANADALSEAGRKLGVDQLFTDYETMLEQAHPDAVIIGTPMHVHAAQSISALERDIHVLCEVTAAVSLDEARWLVQACQRSQAVYMMAENCNYFKETLLIGAMVDAGLFGEVYYAEGDYLHNVGQLHHTAEGKPTWRYYWQVGRNGATYATHGLGPCLQWIKERITHISCIGSGRWTDPEHTIEDTVILSGKTASGKLIRHRLDMLSKRPHPFTVYYALQGTRGAYESTRQHKEGSRVWLEEGATDPNQWLQLAQFEAEFLPAVWRTLPPAIATIGHGGAEVLVLADFIEAVRLRRAPAIDIHAALDMTLPGLVSQESIARQGEWLPVPDSRLWRSTPAGNAGIQAGGHR